MLAGFTLLLICQLLGEALARLLGLNVPGPVIGLILLLLLLFALGEVPASVRLAAEGLLKYLALLFVPAGVGLLVHVELIQRDWQVILIVLTVSTVLTMAATALTLQLLLRRDRDDD